MLHTLTRFISAFKTLMIVCNHNVRVYFLNSFIVSSNIICFVCAHHRDYLHNFFIFICWWILFLLSFCAAFMGRFIVLFVIHLYALCSRTTYDDLYYGLILNCISSKYVCIPYCGRLNWRTNKRISEWSNENREKKK